jgi:hypothetical protein
MLVENLSKNVSCIVNVGAIRPGANANYLNNYLANPGTLQITPITNGDGNDQYVWGQPIFTTPFFTAPLTLPTGWEFTTMAPKAQFDVAVDTTKWAASQAGDQIVLDFAIEYVGAWQDPTAVARILNDVVLTPLFAGTAVIVGTL